ncbi:unnamed protein product, partial [Haemonchus placei]|uniref:Tick transposon n=1 Tax=Haemonchus placei TaxID=6290 RepID=A0A0N4WNY2_HAEPC
WIFFHFFLVYPKAFARQFNSLQRHLGASDDSFPLKAYNIPPEVIYSLPDRLRKKILDIWEERDPNGDCYQQQRRTRLILLNLPPSLWKTLRPKALQCSLPHFIDRLEWDLQGPTWTPFYKLTKQLRLLQQHDISVKSFDMPPPTVFRSVREALQKRRRSPDDE